MNMNLTNKQSGQLFIQLNEREKKCIALKQDPKPDTSDLKAN